MNKRNIARSIRKAIIPAAVIAIQLLAPDANAQGIHFSQYFNAPMLQNPANTGLMSDYDYRAGANYRNQWSSVPAPYRSFSAYVDLQAMRQRNQTSWLGVGLAVYNDKAGNGNLSLTKMQGLVAYHVEMGESAMLSGGFSVSYNQRSIDFSKLTWNMQWDGVTFNTTNPNGEPANGLQKTNFMDVAAGLNLAVYPNENVYLKFGAGLANINQPKETFLQNENKLGMRPTGTVDALFKTGRFLTVNPSVFYTYQKTASELVYGVLFSMLAGGDERSGEHLIIGAYNRFGDAIVAAAGFEFDGFRLMATYDVTISNLAQYNRGNGAFEVGLRWQGLYGNLGGDRRVMNCPRF